MAINRDFVKGWAQNELTSGEDDFASWIDPLEQSVFFFNKEVQFKEFCPPAKTSSPQLLLKMLTKPMALNHYSIAKA